MSQWTDEQIRELESDDYWDYSGEPEPIQPAPAERRGSVASVRFTVQDFRQIGLAAEQAGVGVVEYVRRAAITAAQAQLGAAPSTARRSSKRVPKAG